ncbi:MAG: leucyl/phenylalanyl-tRNA--protein transferase [Pseudomonadota bacterium]
MSLYWLGTQPGVDFPDPESALDEPNGLLAAGGDLAVERLLAAYQRGIFPWYSEGQPILWWSPDPRMVLRPADFHASRSLRRTLRRGDWSFTTNRDFEGVIDACAESRPGQEGTWITPAMRRAYIDLHQAGWAHSVEVCLDGQLAGGVYGVAIDGAFFGESMFHRLTDASKLALWYLCTLLERDGFAVLDCQMHTAHLETLGATNLSRQMFCELLSRCCTRLKAWQPAPISEALG